MNIKLTMTVTGMALLWSVSSHAVVISTQTPHPYSCKNCERLSHDTLTTHWPIRATSLGHTTQHQQISKKYAVNTTFKELEKGLVLYTQAPSAVIRISSALPQSELKAASDFKPTFYIKTKKSGQLSLNEASSLIAANDELNNSYFAKNTPAILQLKPELGSGKITLLASPSPGHENDLYVVHVYDKEAKSYLTVETNKAMYQYGDQLTTTMTLGDDLSNYPLDSVKATMVNPDGKAIPLTLKQNNDRSYTASIPLKSETNTVGDHEYIEVETTATLQGNVIHRQAHTAFTYSIPSAVISDINQTDSFSFKATLNVATGSRYALQAVLFKADNKGNKIPLEIAQSASWLTPGNHDITFSFSPENKNTSPDKFYVGALELIDYGQIKPVFMYNSFVSVNTEL